MAHLTIGTTLKDGEYIIRRVLGQGGFGITYEAELVRLEKRVVLKELFLSRLCGRASNGFMVIVMDNNLDFFDSQKRRFVAEAKRIAKLHNAHIVQVHDQFEENGTAYYVMDFIEGKSLANHLKHSGKPFDETVVSDILNQMLDALECIHGQQPPLLHLDIKPDNIMMEGKSVTLIDFGASKQLSADERNTLSSSTMAYTPGHAPLEQTAQQSKDIGPWTDFYALGATLYHMVTGNTPPEVSVTDSAVTCRASVFSVPQSVWPTLSFHVSLSLSPNRSWYR